MFAFVVLSVVSLVSAKRVAGKNVSKITCFVSNGPKIISHRQSLFIMIVHGWSALPACSVCSAVNHVIRF